MIFQVLRLSKTVKRVFFKTSSRMQSFKPDLDSNLPKIKSGRKANFFHTIEKILFEVGVKLKQLKRQIRQLFAHLE
jgi:hypothetical protein